MRPRGHSIEQREETLEEMLTRMAANAIAPTEEQARADTSDAQQHLMSFARQAWPIIEPARPFKDGWHIGCIAEHLQAVTELQIRNLIINVPPRHWKSTALVSWFCWSWTREPSSQWICCSYGEGLSLRDANKCKDIIGSDWYRRRWGHLYRLKKGQQGAERFANTRQGYRISTTVGGKAMGEGGDYLCLPPDEIVWTEFGPLPIKTIVDAAAPIRVWSYNTATGAVELKPVVEFHNNPGSAIVEVVLSDGARVRCTPDHELWTINRGWVEAIDLLSSDVLPNPSFAGKIDSGFADAMTLRNLSMRTTLGDDRSYCFVRNFGFPSVAACFSGKDFLCEVSPGQSFPDGVDFASADTVTSSEDARRFVAGGNLLGDFGGNLCARAFFAKRECPVALGVFDVPGPSAVLQVIQSAVVADSVLVPDFLSIGDRTEERQRHALMDAHGDRLATDPDIESRVAIASRRSLQKSPRQAIRAGSVGRSHQSAFAADETQVGDTVESIGSRNRSPVSVRHVGYSERTYCLTVADNHNMLAGLKSIAVCNCYDDPHKPNEVRSDFHRQQVIDNWTKTMATRGNDPQTVRKVLVMQRLHENDLTGYLLAERDNYEHLCLPAEYEPQRYWLPGCGTDKPRDAIVPTVLQRQSKRLMDPRTEEGQPLWPEQFGPMELAALKVELEGPGWSGQGQQRPGAADGIVFKKEYFKTFSTESESGRVVVVLNNPDCVKRCWIDEFRFFQVIDTAMTKNKRSAWTCCATVAWSRTSRALLVWNVWRAKVQVPYQLPIIMEFRDGFPGLDIQGQIVLKGALRPWPSQIAFQAIEEKASGIGILQESLLRGKPLRALKPGSADKVLRAAAVATMYNAGMVYHMAKAQWLTDFEDELLTFPNSRWSDQADTLAYAGRLAGEDALLNQGIDGSLTMDVPRGPGGKPLTLEDLRRQSPTGETYVINGVEVTFSDEDNLQIGEW